MQTVSGNLILPENGVAPSLYDIGWGLARTARFAGQTKKWYSVLPHTYVVAHLVPKEHELDAMLHDASEVIIADQVSTWKNEWTKADERAIQGRIYSSLGKPYDFNEDIIKKADLHARAAEAELLGHPNAAFFLEVEGGLDIEMFDEALTYTRKMLQIYTPEYCTKNTNLAALHFETEVSKLLQVSQTSSAFVNHD